MNWTAPKILLLVVLFFAVINSAITTRNEKNIGLFPIEPTPLQLNIDIDPGTNFLNQSPMWFHHAPFAPLPEKDVEIDAYMLLYEILKELKYKQLIEQFTGDYPRVT